MPGQYQCAQYRLITNLPQDCVVEVPCLVDGLGIHPALWAIYRPACRAHRSNIAVQELAVKAALEGDREALFHAVALDPLTRAAPLEQIRRSRTRCSKPCCVDASVQGKQAVT